MNFAVLASGYGGNLQAIIDAQEKKKFKGQLKLVISNKSNAFALERAKKAGIASLYIDQEQFKDRVSFDKKVLGYLKEFDIDFVVLAGYMRLLSAHFIKAYPNKILNIHPALLPSFKGVHGIRDAYEYGVKVTGVSVHFVNEEMDGGAIIAQEVVVIRPKDTLKSLVEKIHKAEHKLYPAVIDLFARGKVKLLGRRAVLR